MITQYAITKGPENRSNQRVKNLLAIKKRPLKKTHLHFGRKGIEHKKSDRSGPTDNRRKFINGNWFIRKESILLRTQHDDAVCHHETASRETKSGTEDQLVVKTDL